MTRTEYTLKPETAAEKDGIKALKLAMNDYAPSRLLRLFSFGGDLLAVKSRVALRCIRAKIEAVKIDEHGRDANGIDIRAATETLNHVKGG